MTMEKTDHAKRVNSWMEEVAKDAPVASLLLLFEAAWSALWRRAENAVGEVALGSIAELVRSKSVERYQFLSPLSLEADGISCKALLESAGSLEKGEVQEGLRFMLVELLTIIGDLTDQVLTPGLYEELSRIALESKIQSNTREHIPPERPARTKEVKAMSVPTKDH